MKLCIITRDGRAARDFTEEHNLKMEDVKVIKKASDLSNCEGASFVTLRPFPNGYQWSIRPFLSRLKMKNLNRIYNKHKIKF